MLSSEGRILRPARPEEAKVLSDLALASKAHWGYSREFLEACREELSVPREKLENPNFIHVLAEGDSGVLGFYGLEILSPTKVELDSLFVLPASIGTGLGRLLLGHAVGRGRDLGAATMIIQGDPNAHAFYTAAGARQVGTRPSGSIPGRELPLYVLELRPEAVGPG